MPLHYFRSARALVLGCRNTVRAAVLGAAIVAGLSASTSAAEVPDLTLTLRLLGTEPPRIELQLDFQAPAEGPTELALTPGWAGVEDPAADLQTLAAFDARTNALVPVVQTEHDTWLVASEPNQPLRVTTTLRYNGHRTSTDPRIHYRPLLEPGLFHAMAELTVPRPRHLDNAHPRDLRVQWEGFANEGWETACSLGLGEGPFDATLPLRKLREMLFVAGEIDVQTREVHGRTVATALSRDGWSFTAAQHADLVERILDLERSFFHDFDPPFFLITQVAVGGPAPLGRYLGGTSLFHSFATFTTPKVTLRANPDRGMDLPRLLIHELFHQWNGRTVRLGEREARSYWFTEGFTEFYTRRFAIAGGWYDVDDFVRDLNAEIDEYLDSPRRGATADEIEAEFFTDPRVQRVPYLRGSLMAAVFDYELRRRTVGARNIDDFLRDLVTEAREEGGLQLDEDGIFQRITRATSVEFAAHLRAVAEFGAPLELPADLFAPALAGQRQSDGRMHFAPTLDSAGILAPRLSGR